MHGLRSPNVPRAAAARKRKKTPSEKTQKQMRATTQKQETKVEEVIAKIKSKYAIPPLAPAEPLRLAVDGLSENLGGGIGLMGAGVHLKQGGQVLVAEFMCLGHGSCNEAEYLALLSGLRITRALYPNPDVPVIAQSDSQLVVHQVQGVWKAKNRMKDFCRALMALRAEYPYELVQVPREQNQVADSLAQNVVLKDTGRSLSLDNGRFNVSKAALGKGKRRNAYQDLTTQEFRGHIEQFNLRGNFARLRTLIEEERRDEAAALVKETMERAQWVLENAPLSNARIEQWVKDTVGIIQTALAEVNKCMDRWDVDGIRYFIDEMAGQPSDTDGAEMWQADQIEPPQGAMWLGQLMRPSGGEFLGDDDA